MKPILADPPLMRVPAGRRRVPPDLPVARGYAGPPCPRRHLWCVVILSCPWCGTLHTHRSGDPERLLRGRLVRRCGTTGKQYRISPMQVRRTARREPLPYREAA